jgi:cell division protein ZapA (FtsZ GTPase activity inhibitor)
MHRNFGILMETVRLNIAGREYPLRAPAAEVENLRRAAATINAQFDAFKAQFNVEDPVDLLAMTALHLATEGQPKVQERGDATPPLSEATRERMAEISTHLERLLEV